jgi:hypothetical protein
VFIGDFLMPKTSCHGNIQFCMMTHSPENATVEIDPPSELSLFDYTSDGVFKEIPFSEVTYIDTGKYLTPEQCMIIQDETFQVLAFRIVKDVERQPVIFVNVHPKDKIYTSSVIVHLVDNKYLVLMMGVRNLDIENFKVYLRSFMIQFLDIQIGKSELVSDGIVKMQSFLRNISRKEFAVN